MISKAIPVKIVPSLQGQFITDMQYIFVDDDTYIGWYDYRISRVVNTTNSLVLNSSANSIEADVDIAVILGGGRSDFPNKIGSKVKPTGTDFTPRDFTDDVNYVDKSASVSTNIGGYDNVNNQQAGVIAGAHNYLKYNPGGHSAIYGGSYNLISAERSFIGCARRCTITGLDSIFSFIGSGDDNNIVGKHSVIAGGIGNKIGDKIGEIYSRTDGGFIGTGTDCSVQGNYSAALTGQRIILTGSYSLGHGLDITVSGRNSYGLGQDNSVTHDYCLMMGRDGVSRSNYSSVLSHVDISEKGDCQSDWTLQRGSTTNDTPKNADSEYRLPIGKITHALCEVKVIALIDGGTKVGASFWQRIDLHWDDVLGEGSFAISPTEETVQGPNPLQDIPAIRNSIGIINVPQLAMSGGNVRCIVEGLDATSIKWAADLKILSTFVS